MFLSASSASTNGCFRAEVPNPPQKFPTFQDRAKAEDRAKAPAPSTGITGRVGNRVVATARAPAVIGPTAIGGVKSAGYAILKYDDHRSTDTSSGTKI